jgi:aminomethyltransferase
MKQSCLYEKLGQLNARFETVQEWALPLDFGSVEKEHQALRQRAGILDFSHRGKIKVSGKDRAAFLHNMLSNDIKGLKPLEVRYAVLLTPKGKIISDLFIYALPDEHLLECGPENTSKIIERLNSFIITEDVHLEDVTEQYALLSLQGPLAVPAISKLNSEAGIQIFQHARLKTPGLDLLIPRSEAVSFWEEISRFENFQPVGFSAYEIVRIEDGIPEYGKELDETIIPNEANLEKAISFTKGCYPGQEIVARIKYLGGVQRKLSGLIIEGNEIPEKGTPLFLDETSAGTLTSACYSPSLKSVIGLGYLKASLQSPEITLNAHWKEKNLKTKVRPIE